MDPVSEQRIRAVVEILGTPNIEDVDIETEVRKLVDDEMTSRRLIDWIPEVFGYVLISHISDKLILPKTFSAQSGKGQWVEFPFELEPIFAAALKIAQFHFHEGPKDLFQNIASRSSMANTVNRALETNRSLDGAVLSGPALIGIPANIYSRSRKPFWRKWFGDE